MRRFCGPPALRFAAKVDRSQASPGGCWLWTAKLDHDGYAVMWLDREHTNYRAARLAYELAGGSVPPGHVIRHRCDNPACVNSDHLLTGTQTENMMDAVERGRLEPTSNLALGWRQAVRP